MIAIIFYLIPGILLANSCLKQIKQKLIGSPKLAIYVSIILVLITWPYYVLSAAHAVIKRYLNATKLQ